MKTPCMHLTRFSIKRSIIDPVENDVVDVFLPPTKLNVESFQDIKHHVVEAVITDLSKK